MTIRAAGASDRVAIRALDAAAFGEDAWSEIAWQGEWDGVPETRHLVVADAAGRVVGFGVLSIVGEVADLHRVAVERAWRGRRLGRQLVEAMIDEARRRGCDRMLLEVEADNTVALALYDRLGFAETTRYTAYYGPGRDALVLERRLG